MSVMLANVYAKSLRDRWVGTTVATLTLAALFALGLSVYADLDLSFYDQAPEAMRSLMGIPEGADAAALAYNVLYGTFAALTVAGLAVSMGSASIAGEEGTGTLGLLLSNPRSRAQVLAAKLAAMVSLVVTAGVLLWAAGRAAPGLVRVDIGNAHVEAVVVHLCVNALLYGCLAMAIGAWSGRRSLASTISGGLLAVSFVAVGLLPLADATRDLVKLVPWYYHDRSQPMVNGLEAGDLGLLLAGSVLCCVAAFIGLRRRDLREREVRRSLLDRLRGWTLTSRIADRLAGSARVSGIAARRASEHQGTLLVVAALMFAYMGLLIGFLWTAIGDLAAEVLDQFPEDVLVFSGGVGDMATPAGFYWGETFGMMAPIAVILVTTLVATRGVAGEQRARTMGLLLANPVSRTRVMAEITAVMVGYTVVVGGATFFGVAGGSLIGGMGLPVGHIAAAVTQLVLLGLVFGGLAMAVAAATGQPRQAVWVTVLAAVVAHVTNAFGSLAEAWWARLSPFHWYGSNEPLATGFDLGHLAVLAVGAAVLVAIAFWLFEHRDLRHG